MKKLALPLATAAVLFGFAAPASADLITEPTHFTVEFTPGPCDFEVANGRSVHSGTTVVVHDLETWDQLWVASDVERAADVTTVSDLVVPESGRVDVYVIPTAGGISSLDVEDFGCTPKPAPPVVEPVEPVVVPEPVVDYTEPVPVVEVETETETGEEHAPVTEPAPVVVPEAPAPAPQAPVTPAAQPEAVTPDTTPTPAPEAEPAATVETAPVETIERTELAHTAVESGWIAAAGTLLLAAGTMTATMARRTRKAV